MTPGYALFETTLGTCGVAWGERGILRVHLPARDRAATVSSLVARAPGAREMEPPAPVRDAIERMTALLAGIPTDLTGVPLDMRGVPEFDARVYEVTRGIEPGSVLTYGDVAQRLGAPGAAQAVGRAMGANPFPIVVPCHRVVAANGAMHGFSAPGGVSTKRRMLAIEGYREGGALDLFDDQP